MKRYRSRDDDDDIVQDGERVRVPLTMMDSMDRVQKAVARASDHDRAAGTRRPRRLSPHRAPQEAQEGGRRRGGGRTHRFVG